MYNKTRSQFTQRDYRFVAQTLGTTRQEQAAILQLAEDPSTFSGLLHNQQLFERSMTIPPVFLAISPQLFFYIFIYQALEHKHIADDDVADYVAGICVEFRASQSLWQFSSAGEKTMYAVDLLNLLGDVDKHQQYFVRRFIGNISLFLTGFFPDFIFQRCKNGGAPPMQYYEHIGRSQYETAAGDSYTYETEAAPVLNTLAERFVDIRSAINVYTDAYLKMNNQKNSLDIIDRQANTLDEQSFRESLEL